MGTNLLINPSFETGDFSGWSVTGSGSGSVISSGSSYDGSHLAQANFGYYPEPLILSQNIGVLPGHNYAIGFVSENIYGFNEGGNDYYYIVQAETAILANKSEILPTNSNENGQPVLIIYISPNWSQIQGTWNSGSATTLNVSFSNSEAGGNFGTTGFFDNFFVRDVGVSPTISGTVAGQTTPLGKPTYPFAGVTIGDTNAGATDSLTISLSGASGVLSGVGALVDGKYVLQGAAAQITAALDAASFTPNTGSSPSLTTTFTLSDTSSAFSTPTTDANTSVVQQPGLYVTPMQSNAVIALREDAKGVITGTNQKGTLTYVDSTATGVAAIVGKPVVTATDIHGNSVRLSAQQIKELEAPLKIDKSNVGPAQGSVSYSYELSNTPLSSGTKLDFMTDGETATISQKITLSDRDGNAQSADLNVTLQGPVAAKSGIDIAYFPGLSVMQNIIKQTNASVVDYYLTPAPSQGKNLGWMGNAANLKQQGWTLEPIYVGRQSLGTPHKAGVQLSYVTDNATAATDASDDALQAGAYMHSEGFSLGTTVYLDVEASGAVVAKHAEMVTYIKDWCADIAKDGYSPGVYCINGVAKYVPSNASLYIAYLPSGKNLISQVDATSSGGNVLPEVPPGALSTVSRATGWQYAQDQKGIPGSVLPKGIDLDTWLLPEATTQTALVKAADLACFASGTCIRTSKGETAVEKLLVGDIVVTSTGRYRPIRWLGHRTVDCRNHPRPHEVLPVRVAAQSFGKNSPTRDLFLSPGHAICVDVLGEVLVPAGALVNGSTIAQVEVDEITYWHVELDSHDVILAEGLPAESYLEMGNRTFFEGDVVALHAGPDARVSTHADFCRPYVAEGPLLEAIKARLGEERPNSIRPATRAPLRSGQ